MLLSAWLIRSRSRAPMRRRDRAASLLSRKSQLMLEVLEPHVLPSGDLLLPLLDRRGFLGRHLFGRREATNRAHVPADRIAQRFCPAQALPPADTIKLRQLLWR